MVALFDSTITFHAQYQQRHDIPALLDLLVLDRDNPRSLGWVAQTLRGRLAKLAGSAPGEVPDIALTVPDPEHWSLEAMCERDADGRYTALLDLLQQCTDAAYKLSDDLGARYFTHSGDAPLQRRAPDHAAARPPRNPLRLFAGGEDGAAHGAPEARPQRAAAAAEPPADDQPRRPRSRARRSTSTATPARSSACEAMHEKLQGDGRKPGVHVGAAPCRKASMPWEEVRERMRYHRGAAYDPAAEFVFASPYVPRHEDFAGLCAAQLHARPAACWQPRSELMQRIYADFEYESEATDVSTPALEALADAQGRVPGLRPHHAGLPAQPGPAGTLRQRLPAHRAAAGQSRGWSAAMRRTPGCRCTCPATDAAAGSWADLDPTNNRAPGEDYVTLATGRDYSDVSPMRGVLHGGANHKLHVAVTVTPGRCGDAKSRRSYNRLIPRRLHERLRQAERTGHHSAAGGDARRRLRAVRADRQPGVPLGPHRQEGRQVLGRPARQEHDDRRRQAGRARRRHRPDGHAACGRGRPQQGQAHRQADEPGQLHRRVHRAAPGHQRRQRIARRRCSARRASMRAAAFGVAQIPTGACVEIEMVAEIG